MKLNLRSLSLLLALILLTTSAAGAEEIFLDSDSRVSDLYIESVETFDDYLSLSVPKNWQFEELSKKDIANGILGVCMDDPDTPSLKLTVSLFTPQECTDIFGGTGYDAVYSDLLDSYDDTASINVNGIWTIAYTKFKDDHELSIFDIVCSDGYMYQIRFDIYDEGTDDILNNIILSLHYA